MNALRLNVGGTWEESRAASACAASPLIERWQEIVATLEGMLVQIGDRGAELTPELRRDLGLD